jgi:N-acetylmuramoyl-L-alanine amidase
MQGDNQTTIDGLSDQEIIARTLSGEARSEGYRGQQAVANVIDNRLANGCIWWGSTYRTICLCPFQFSAWNPGDPNRPKLLAVTTADPVFEQCMDIAGLLLAGQLDDVSGSADSYKVVGSAAEWAVGLQPVRIIGKHAFYQTVNKRASVSPATVPSV